MTLSKNNSNIQFDFQGIKTSGCSKNHHFALFCSRPWSVSCYERLAQSFKSVEEVLNVEKNKVLKQIDWNCDHRQVIKTLSLNFCNG